MYTIHHWPVDFFTDDTLPDLDELVQQSKTARDKQKSSGPQATCEKDVITLSSDESSDIEVCDLPANTKTTHPQEEEPPHMNDMPVPSQVADDRHRRRKSSPINEPQCQPGPSTQMENSDGDMLIRR